MAAVTPDLVVEIAFVSNPLDTAPTWVDVSPYVRADRGVHISRGRGTESESFQPGRLSLTLSNRDRRFDPLHAAGPYFGNLLPRKQIRVRALWNAVYYPMFKGFVTGWPQEYATGDKDAWVSVDAYDGLTWLAGVAQPDVLALTTQTTIGSCIDWWRFIISGSWYDTVGGKNASLQPPVVVGSTSTTQATVGGSIVPGSASSSSAGGLWLHDVVAPGTAWTASVWFQTTMVSKNVDDPVSVASVYPLGLVSDLDVPAVQILDGYAGVHGDVWILTQPDMGIGIVTDVNDGLLHHLVITATPATNTYAVYLDGVLRYLPVDTASALSVSRFDASVNYMSFIGAEWVYEAAPDFTIQDVAYFGKALTAAEVALLYGVGSGFLAELTSARVTRLLDNIGWPATWRSIATGDATAAEYTPLFKSTLSELQQVEATEQGRVFVDASGNLTFHNRYHYLEVTRGKTSQANLSDDGAGIVYRMFGTDYDEREVYNDINVVGARGVYGSATDATSKTAYGPHSKSITTLLPTADDCTALATGLLQHAKNAQTRTRPIEVQGSRQTAQWPTLLGLEIGDRLTVEITPMRNVGSQTVLPVLLEQIEWNLEPRNWVMSVGAVPVPGGGTAGSSWFILDDATYGVLGTGRLGP